MIPRFRVDLHPEAADEAAAAWYREHSEAAADAFVLEIERAIKSIADAPDRWPPFVAGTRRFLLRRFPFSVVYREVAGSIEIIAIAHARRRPGYWRER